MGFLNSICILAWFLQLGRAHFQGWRRGGYFDPRNLPQATLPTLITTPDIVGNRLLFSFQPKFSLLKGARGHRNELEGKPHFLEASRHTIHISSSPPHPVHSICQLHPLHSRLSKLQSLFPQDVMKDVILVQKLCTSVPGWRRGMSDGLCPSSALLPKYSQPQKSFSVA